MVERFITLWRKPPPNVLDWEFHISERADEVPRVIANIKEQGVWQYSTYALGEKIGEFSNDH